MSSFDAAFFDELARLDDATVAAVLPMQGHQPSVADLHHAGRLSRAFADTTFEFVDALARRSRGRHRFDPGFRVYPFHIADFTARRAFRRQFNMGLTSDPRTGEHHARIGLGFMLARGLKPQGVDDYTDFLMKLLADGPRFDAIFGALGGYAEPTEVFRGPVSAVQVCAHSPDFEQDWRFFGAKLTQAGIAALGSMDAFADECVRIFGAIAAAGY